MHLAQRSSDRTPVAGHSGRGNETTIEFDDGGFEVRSGGSRAWRNHNPGNLRNYFFSQSAGSIGEAGGASRGVPGFAVFPDDATGYGALSDLLQTGNYQARSVADTIAAFAPPIENNTAAYLGNVRSMTGLDGTRLLSSLSLREHQALIRSISRIEGWIPGTVTAY